MATSERRTSFGASSIGSARRASSSSLQLPPLPPSTDSLVSGTSIPPPAPSSTGPPVAPFPPVKAPAVAPLPLTPQRKPVLRQKSPLSNEPYFASPASSMPGTFPSTPPPVSPSTGMQPAQFSTTVSASGSSPSTTSKSPKRPSSVRNLLSFKALRRSSNHTSPDTHGFRPTSPSAESTLSSSQPSLSKKRSGTFWRRKSSLGMTFGKEGEIDEMSSNPGIGTETVPEEASSTVSPTPNAENDFPTVKKRKSGTFWRRKSSLGMASAMDPTRASGEAQREHTNGLLNSRQSTVNAGHSSRDAQQNHLYSNQGANGTNGHSGTEKPLPDMPTRSWSPPPQLPAFIGGGAGLGEDLFKDIY
ncbi:hypothetical protein ACLMJK_004336 [Lecanora helva]